MSEPLRFVVGLSGSRIDRLVADATGQGRRAVRQLLAAGRVRVDGRIARGSDSAAQGSEIVVEITARTQSPGLADLPSPAMDGVRIIAETDRWLAVAKPAGMHCERGRSGHSLAEWLDQRFGLSGVGDRLAESGLVHRLDCDTSGVVIAARRRTDYRRLRSAFRAGLSRKQYLALASGRLGPGTLEVRASLARRRDRMALAGPDDAALAAVTRFDALDGGSDWTLVQATMSSGAMHQVRVHLASAGHPLFGDSLYGGPALPQATRHGQWLHALRISIAGELDVTCGPPEDFVAAYARLRRTASAVAVSASS